MSSSLFLRLSSFVRSYSFLRLSSILRSSFILGHLHVSDCLHSRGCLHFLSCLLCFIHHAWLWCMKHHASCMIYYAWQWCMIRSDSRNYKLGHLKTKIACVDTQWPRYRVVDGLWPNHKDNKTKIISMCFDMIEIHLSLVYW